MATLSPSKSSSALGASFRGTARRKGVAVFATARKLAVHIDRMLRYGQDYVDEGMEAYEQRFRRRRLNSIRSIAQQMGFQLIPAHADSEIEVLG